MFLKRSMEMIIMVITFTNMTYHEYQGMFDIALFLKKLSKVSIKLTHNKVYVYCRQIDYLCSKV